MNRPIGTCFSFQFASVSSDEGECRKILRIETEMDLTGSTMEDNKMVTRKEFMSYENVRRSGKYNMIMDAVSAMAEAGLSKDKYLEIIKNYQMYADKYLKKNS